MKKLILTSAFILGSIVTVFAQASRPGQPIGGIVVKGGQNGLTTIEGNPLYNPSGNTAQNPMSELRAHSDMGSAGTVVNPYFKDNTMPGQMANRKVAGNPIGGIIVKGGHNGRAAAGNISPLYDAQGLEVTSALYQGGVH
jgi:hypothetical protein